MIRDTKTIAIVDLQNATDETKSALAAVALETYRGERCRFCKEPIASDEDLRDGVFAGYHEGGRTAHGRCWRALSSDEQEALKTAQRQAAERSIT